MLLMDISASDILLSERTPVVYLADASQAACVLHHLAITPPSYRFHVVSQHSDKVILIVHQMTH